MNQSQLLFKFSYRPIKFVMAGGVRNEGDEKRANDIEALGNGRRF